VTLRLARLGLPWLCVARSCAREVHGESTVSWEPKAQVVLAWRAAQLLVEVRIWIWNRASSRVADDF